MMHWESLLEYCRPILFQVTFLVHPVRGSYPTSLERWKWFFPSLFHSSQSNSRLLELQQSPGLHERNSNNLFLQGCTDELTEFLFFMNLHFWYFPIGHNGNFSCREGWQYAFYQSLQTVKSLYILLNAILGPTLLIHTSLISQFTRDFP